jgi:3-oxoacyl-[acyl-carrier protein] reductase
MKLKDKVVVVTGGGTGIGRGICLRFAREGAAVVVNYSKSKMQAKEVVAEIENLGGKAADIQADVSADREARQLIEKAVSHFNRLDVLVNNAAWTRYVPHPNLEDLTEEILENTWSVIVKGSIYCIRAAVPYLGADGGGSVINITSNAGFSARGSTIVYGASKAALTFITKALARALAPDIRVNAIAPGFVDTGFVNWTPEVLDQLKRQTHLGKSILPENIGDAAVFLASDAIATTGQTILVDGGVAALGPHN